MDRHTFLPTALAVAVFMTCGCDICSAHGSYNSDKSTDLSESQPDQKKSPKVDYEGIWSVGNGLYTYGILAPDTTDSCCGMLWGLLDSEFNVVLEPCESLPIIRGDNDYITVCKDGSDLSAVLDRKGKVILPFDSDLKNVSGEWCLTSDNGSFEPVERTIRIVHLPDGKVRSSFKMKDTPMLAGTVLVSFKNGKYALHDLDGKPLTPYEYDEIDPNVSEGLIAAAKGLKVGFLNEKGETAIPFIYTLPGDEDGFAFEFCVQFHEGLTSISNGSKWGYIDTSGSVVLPFKYSFASDFHNGLAEVSIDKGDDSSQEFIIDKSGNIIYSDSSDYNSEFVLETRQLLSSDPDSGLYGVRDLKGNWVIPAQYEMALPFTMNGNYVVKEGEVWHLIDPHGKMLRRNFTRIPGIIMMPG